jgi:hypothetical protein
VARVKIRARIASRNSNVAFDPAKTEVEKQAAVTIERG